MRTLIHTLNLMFLVVCATHSYAQTTAIPDSNFEQALIDLGHDTGPTDGTILTATANAVTGTLDLKAKGISNLTGIEAFTSITFLDLRDGNSITTLDLSALTQLEGLEAAGNGMTSIDVSGLTKLKKLIIQKNKLTSVDLTGLTALETLYLGENDFTSIDVNDSPNITRLYVNGNPNLNTLTFNNVTALDRLRVQESGIRSLSIDLANHPSLSEVVAHDCTSLTTLNFTNSGTGTLALKEVNIKNSAVASLDITSITSLEVLEAENNGMTSITANGVTSLKRLIVHKNNLTSINLTGLSNLEYLYAGENQLTSIDVSGSHDNLVRLFVNDNSSLGNFSVSNLTGLQEFKAYSTAITSLDLSSNANLTQVQIQTNTSLTEVNIANGANIAIATADFLANDNPNLGCVRVDDDTWSDTNWTNIANSTNLDFSTTCTLGVDDFETSSIDVYPNPVVGNQLFILSEEKLTFSMYQVTGKKIKEGALSSGESSINVSDLNKGMYFISLRNSSGSEKNIKFIKK